MSDPIPYFSWPVKRPVNYNVQPDTRTVRFGDSYEEEAANSINPIRRKFSIDVDEQFMEEDDRVPDIYRYRREVEAFLEERGGFKPFFFSYPNSPRVDLVKCTNWAVVEGEAGQTNFTMQLEQVYSTINPFTAVYRYFNGNPTFYLQPMVDFATSDAGRAPQ